MAAILNFRIFAKNGKTQICFYLLNRVRLLLLLLLLCIYTQRNISIYYRTQSAI